MDRAEIEKRARKTYYRITNCKACGNTGRLRCNATCRDCEDGIDLLYRHDLQTHNQAIESTVKRTKELDPLDAECDWESGEEIAYGTQKYIATELEKLKITEVKND
jgi:hypothetical protein